MINFIVIIQAIFLIIIVSKIFLTIRPVVDSNFRNAINSNTQNTDIICHELAKFFLTIGLFIGYVILVFIDNSNFIFWIIIMFITYGIMKLDKVFFNIGKKLYLRKKGSLLL